jgi:hypothetical protein
VITLEQVGHHGWQLTEHQGINLKRSTMFEDPDEAQREYIAAQHLYVELLAQFTLTPLPARPSEIVHIEDDEAYEISVTP